MPLLQGEGGITFYPCPYENSFRSLTFDSLDGMFRNLDMLFQITPLFGRKWLKKIHLDW
jgi:hypothetical protein